MNSRSNITVLPGKSRIKLNNAINEYFKGNDENSLKQLLELEKEKCTEAYVYLGVFYEKGSKNVDIDFEKAKYYYELATESDGTVEAYLALARFYLKGLGVSINYGKAFEIYSKMIKEKNDSLAHLNIGLMYKDGLFVSEDSKKAYEHFKFAWNDGYVLGLTYMGLTEQKNGKWIQGLFMRLKAGVLSFRLAIKSPNDPHLRSGS